MLCLSVARLLQFYLAILAMYQFSFSSVLAVPAFRSIIGKPFLTRLEGLPPEVNRRSRLSFQPHALARHRTGQGRAQRGGAKCRAPLTRRHLEHARAGRARQHDGIGLQAGGGRSVGRHPLMPYS